MKNRKLRALIIEKYGTQSEFAAALGWPDAYVSRMINNWVPPPTNCQEVAEKLDTTVGELWPQP